MIVAVNYLERVEVGGIVNNLADDERRQPLAIAHYFLNVALGELFALRDVGISVAQFK